MADTDPNLPRARKPARIEMHVGDVHVVLEGEAGFVLDAYKEVQAHVTEAIRASGAAPSSEALPRKETSVTRAPQDDGDSELKPRLELLRRIAPRSVLWVSGCNPLFRKVYAAERCRFASSSFARRYGLASVHHIYVEDDRILKALKRDADTLWIEVDR